MVEWLTRSPAIYPSKADAFGRAGSNPVLDAVFFLFFIFKNLFEPENEKYFSLELAFLSASSFFKSNVGGGGWPANEYDWDR